MYAFGRNTARLPFVPSFGYGASLLHSLYLFLGGCLFFVAVFCFQFEQVAFVRIQFGKDSLSSGLPSESMRFVSFSGIRRCIHSSSSCHEEPC
jgi:hypothetical protein